MRDLNAVAIQCMAELKAIGIQYGNVLEFRVNSRARSRWGMCRSVPGGFVIEISNLLLADDTPETSLKNTIIHELLHTCRGGNSHKGAWKNYADKVNRVYGYGIKRVSTSEEKGVTVSEANAVRKEPVVKHRFICLDCEQIIERSRESKFTKNYANYKCGCCGGKFKKLF